MAKVGEQWRAIPGYPKYEASSLGNIRRVKTGRILRPGVSYGYHAVQFGHRGPQLFVHRLVLLAFLGEPKIHDMVANHLNGIRTDNRLENLEWTTRSGNTIHAQQVLGKGIGITHGRARFTEADVMEIRQRWSNGESCAAIGLLFGVSKGVVHPIASGKTWSHLPVLKREIRRANNKLTGEVVVGICRDYATGSFTQKVIAAKYLVDQSTVSDVVRGKFPICKRG